MSKEAKQEGKITEEGLKQLRDIDGATLRISKMRIGNELVCRETIKGFVDGVGDINPLWRDENYAANTRYKHIVAPPAYKSGFGACARVYTPKFCGTAQKCPD